MRGGGDAGQAEQLRHHRPDLMVVVVDRHLAAEDQVPAPVLKLGGEGAGDGEAVGRNLVALQQHAAVRAHRERGADGLLGRGGPESHDHDFAGPGRFLAAQGLFHGELIVGIEYELDARLVERLGVNADFDAGFAVGDAFDTDGNLHAAVRSRSSAASGVSRRRVADGSKQQVARKETWRLGSGNRWQLAGSNYPCDCRLTPDDSTVSPSLASAALCIPPAAQTARRRGGGGRSGSPPRPTACRGARDLGTSF